jgi:3'(2'), 5'-bisphosphate nucleotidase
MIDLKPMIQAVRQAASLTRSVQHSHFAKGEKDQREPVTIADYGSQAILCRALSLAFPDDAVMAEENGAQFISLVADDGRAEVVRLVSAALGEPVTEADIVRWLDHGRDRSALRTWLIDPVDGTKGFIAMRRYSIAVAAIEMGLPVAGILGCPGYPSPDGHGYLFTAQRGGAYTQLISGGAAYRIAVSSRSSPAAMRVVESIEKAHADLSQSSQVYAALGIPAKNVEQLDGQDKYAMIAGGDADLYVRLPREANPRHRAWDHAAGTALVHAAGGVVTDLDGSPLDFSQGAILTRNRGMIISNGALHDKVVAAVADVLKAGS